MFINQKQPLFSYRHFAGNSKQINNGIKNNKTIKINNIYETRVRNSLKIISTLLNWLHLKVQIKLVMQPFYIEISKQTNVKHVYDKLQKVE